MTTPGAPLDALLPCPFCGRCDPMMSGPSNERWFSVHCITCQAHSDLGMSKAEAAIKWNRRAPSPAPASDEREAFEAWAMSSGRPQWMVAMAIGDLKAGEYADARLECEWQAWNARAAVLADRLAARPLDPSQHEEGE